MEHIVVQLAPNARLVIDYDASKYEELKAERDEALSLYQRMCESVGELQTLTSNLEMELHRKTNESDIENRKLRELSEELANKNQIISDMKDEQNKSLNKALSKQANRMKQDFEAKLKEQKTRYTALEHKYQKACSALTSINRIMNSLLE